MLDCSRDKPKVSRKPGVQVVLSETAGHGHCCCAIEGMPEQGKIHAQKRGKKNEYRCHSHATVTLNKGIMKYTKSRHESNFKIRLYIILITYTELIFCVGQENGDMIPLGGKTHIAVSWLTLCLWVRFSVPTFILTMF